MLSSARLSLHPRMARSSCRGSLTDLGFRLTSIHSLASRQHRNLQLEQEAWRSKNTNKNQTTSLLRGTSSLSSGEFKTFKTLNEHKSARFAISYNKTVITIGWNVNSRKENQLTLNKVWRQKILRKSINMLLARVTIIAEVSVQWPSAACKPTKAGPIILINISAVHTLIGTLHQWFD